MYPNIKLIFARTEKPTLTLQTFRTDYLKIII